MDAFSVPAPFVQEKPAKIGVRKSSNSNIADQAVEKRRMTWKEYDDWRETKCMPRDLRPPIWWDELDQAIHELNGECAELSQLLIEPPEDRDLDAVLDEIGDIAFTAVWVISACDKRLIDVLDDSLEGVRDSRGQQNIDADVYSSVASMYAGLCANAFKKARWQHRVEKFNDIPNLALRAIISASVAAEAIGRTIHDAIAANVEKLDRRYPDGWKVGGGNRGK